MQDTIIDPDFFRDASCVEEILLKAESLGLSLGEIFPDMVKGYSVNVHDDYCGHYFVVTADGNFSWFDYTGKPVGNPRSVNIIYRHHIPPGLSKVIIPEGVKMLFDRAFKNSGDTLEEIVLPSTLDIVKDDAFLECSRISRIRFPKNVSHIYPGAFRECSSLREIVVPIRIRCFFQCFAVTNPQIKVKYF